MNFLDLFDMQNYCQLLRYFLLEHNRLKQNYFQHLLKLLEEKDLLLHILLFHLEIHIKKEQQIQQHMLYHLLQQSVQDMYVLMEL